MRTGAISPAHARIDAKPLRVTSVARNFAMTQTQASRAITTVSANWFAPYDDDPAVVKDESVEQKEAAPETVVAVEKLSEFGMYVCACVRGGACTWGSGAGEGCAAAYARMHACVFPWTNKLPYAST